MFDWQHTQLPFKDQRPSSLHPASTKRGMRQDEQNIPFQRKKSLRVSDPWSLIMIIINAQIMFFPSLNSCLNLLHFYSPSLLGRSTWRFTFTPHTSPTPSKAHLPGLAAEVEWAARRQQVSVTAGRRSASQLTIAFPASFSSTGLRKE